MISFKFFLLYILACFLAYSFTYFMPLLQEKLWENNLFQSNSVQDTATSLQQDDVEDTEPVEAERVNGVKSSASAPVKPTGQEDELAASQPSELGTKTGEGKRKDQGVGEMSEESDELPVYPDYSELSVYMLSMLVSEDEEEERSIGASLNIVA